MGRQGQLHRDQPEGVLRLSLLIATLNVFVSERPLRFDTVDRGTALRSSALRRKDPMKNLLTDISGVRVGHARPELFRLLADAHDGDILLTEQVDRLSRLTAADWEKLKAELTARRIRVVALDLPTSWTVAAKATDEFTARMFEAINSMLLDRRRDRPRPSLRAATKDGRRTLSETLELPPCSPPANPGTRYRPRRAARARRSPRSRISRRADRGRRRRQR